MEPHDLRALMETEPDFVTGDGREAAFWMPERFNDGSFWIGRYTGRSPWERHATTDELLHCLDGEVDVTVLTDDGPQTTTLRAGSVFIVPKGHWHRLYAEHEVTQCGVTPGPTYHSTADDPRADDPRVE